MSWFSDLFGGKKDSTREMEQNIPNRKVYGFADVETGPKLKRTIEDRLAGIGVGYDPAAISADTSAFAKQRRASVAEVEKPTIAAEASARGLGRSTIPVNRMALATQAGERDIESRVAQMELANQQQKRSEISDALNKYYEYTKDDIGYKNLKEEVAQADYIRKLGLTEQADAMDSAAMNKIVQTIGGVAVGAAGVATGNPMVALSGLGMAFGNDNLSSLSAIDQIINKRNASMVNKTE